MLAVDHPFRATVADAIASLNRTARHRPLTEAAKIGLEALERQTAKFVAQDAMGSNGVDSWDTRIMVEPTVADGDLWDANKIILENRAAWPTFKDSLFAKHIREEDERKNAELRAGPPTPRAEPLINPNQPSSKEYIEPGDVRLDPGAD